MTHDQMPPNPSCPVCGRRFNCVWCTAPLWLPIVSFVLDQVRRPFATNHDAAIQPHANDNQRSAYYSSNPSPGTTDADHRGEDQ